MKDRKTLVVFYSRTGTTKKVAEAISNILKCDVEEVFDTKNRAGIFGFLSAGWDATFKRLTVIEEIKFNPGSYDIVIIGTPIWNSRISTPIRTYISQYKEEFKNVAFFCTYRSSGSERVFKDMESLCGKSPLALLGLKMEEVRIGNYIPKIEEFIHKL